MPPLDFAPQPEDALQMVPSHRGLPSKAVAALDREEVPDFGLRVESRMAPRRSPSMRPSGFVVAAPAEAATLAPEPS